MLEILEYCKGRRYYCI